MPQVGPGNDNITGESVSLKLGLEPDLGDLLQNLTVANDVLDSIEQKFMAIGDVVQSTTQRTAQLTRQTELLAAQTTRLQNSYQAIAQASGTLSGIGAMAGGYGGYGGGYPGMMPMPGQMAFGGMPTQMNQLQTMPTGVSTEAGEDIPSPGVGRPVRPQSFPLSVRAAALEELSGRWQGKGGPIGTPLSAMRAGFQQARGRTPSTNILKSLPRFSPTQLADPAFAAKTGPVSGVIGGEAQTFASAAEALATPGVEAASIAGLGAAEGGSALAGGIGSAVGVAAPYVLAGIAAYKLISGQVAEATRLSGVTGGTGVISGTGSGGFDTSAAGLRLRSMGLGLLHPGVDVGRTQEEALGAGYTGGAYTQARDYLFEAAKRGMSDTVDQLDMYQEAIDKAGGSTQTLVGSLDRLRTVAVSTNSNLTAMTQNYKDNLESFVGMGMSGNTAMNAALQQSTMFATNPIMAMNPVTRNSGGYDIANPLNQAQLTAQLGVGYNMLGVQSALTPGLGSALPAMTEKVVQNTLSNMGFNKGQDFYGVLRQMKNSGLGSYTGQVLQQMGALPQGVDPNDLRSVATSIMGTYQGSAKGAEKAAMGAAAPTAAGQVYRSTSSDEVFNGDMADLTPTGTPGMMQDNHGNFWKAENASGSSYVAGMNITLNDQEQPLIGAYESSIDKTGKVNPIINNVLKQGADAANNTYIQSPDGKYMTLQQFMETDPKWSQKISNPQSGYQIATASAAQIQAIDSSKTKDRSDQLSLLGFSSGADYVAGTAAAATTETDTGDTQRVELDPFSVQQLVQGFKDAIAQQ